MKSELEDVSVMEHPPAKIKIEKDIESGSSVATCRICLDSQGDNKDDALISPCMCKGTQKFVHRSCLDRWRSVKEGHAFSHCTTCKAQFHLRVIDFEEESWRKIKFRLLVAGNVFLVFLAVQALIVLMGGLAYVADKDGSFRNSFNDKWELSSHPIPFYYCIGVIVFCVLLGIFGNMLFCYTNCQNNNGNGGCFCIECGQCAIPGEGCAILLIVLVVIILILGIAYAFFAATMAIQGIWQRHYHVLTKRELTQEYVVEDLNGGYTPAKLDPEHMERLKILKLW